MTKIRPFLKWAGNKFRCIDHILASLPQGRRLIEPFTGSGAIFINTHYAEYILGENNLDLVNLFTLMQQQGASFITHCQPFFSAKNNTSLQYYQFREQFNDCHDTLSRAALFLYLNRHGYNGLCRYNSKGTFNVPFGRYQKPYFPLEEMHFFHHKSQQAQFLHADFRTTFAMAQAGDVIYCDPPYVPLSRSANFATYTNKRFNEQDQIALAELAKKAANRDITVIISNHDTDFTRQHYEGADITTFPVRRQISCKANARLLAQEMVAIFR